MASARAIGASIPFFGLGFMADGKLGMGEIPEIEKLYIWFYISCGCLLISSVAIARIIPRTLVTELNDEDEIEDDHFRSQNYQYARGKIVF